MRININNPEVLRTVLDICIQKYEKNPQLKLVLPYTIHDLFKISKKLNSATELFGKQFTVTLFDEEINCLHTVYEYDK